MRIGFTPVSAIAMAVVASILVAVLLWSLLSAGSSNEGGPLIGSGISGSDDSDGGQGPEVFYAIENAALECRGGASWLSVTAVGPALGVETVYKMSPVTPGSSEGSYDSVGGLRPVDAQVTSTRLASDVFGQKDYYDDTSMAETVEATVPDFIKESNYLQFQVVLAGTNSAGQKLTSNGLLLDTRTARC